MGSSTLPSKTLEHWRAARHAELAGPDSWLGLVGLFWLEDGRSSVGQAENNAIRLPSGPAHLGDLICQGGEVWWHAVNTAAQRLETDHLGQPTVVTCGDLAFFIVEREGRFAVRLRDRAWATTRPFSGVTYFPEDPQWVVEADWLPIDPPLTMEVPNVTGELKPVSVAFKAVFEKAGAQVELLPMSVSEREVFFVFRDRTSGKETYGAGRFLKAKPAQNGKIGLDFNRAFNPPCAFTPFATCPLPPPENWLPFAVPAGEQKWAEPH